MTVRKAATFGFDGGKGAACAASGVVAPHREFHPPAPEGEWMSGGGARLPSGGSQSVLADVGLAHLALGQLAALSVQGEALQQLALKAGKACAQGGAGAAGSVMGPRAAQGFVKVQNEPETHGRHVRCSGKLGGKGTRQHRAPAAKEGCPSTRPLRGAVIAASTGNAIIGTKEPMTTTWSGLPGQGLAEKGEERPARRRVWPVASSVPASTREAARARRGEGATLIMRHDRIIEDQGSGRQISRQLLEFMGCQVPCQHGQDVGTCRQVQAEHDGAVDQLLWLDAQLVGALLKTAGRFEADLPATVVTEFGKPPRCQSYGPSGWMTRTSCRSGRSSATGTSPWDSRSMAMARSVGHWSAPLSKVLIRPREAMPSLTARSA